MTSAESHPSAAMDFLVAALRKDKAASFAELKARAEMEHLKVFPILYGRAKAMLGLVPLVGRGAGMSAPAAAPAVAVEAARRGRPRDGNSKSARVRELLATDMSPAEIAKRVGCTVGLVYNVKSAGGRTKQLPVRPHKTTQAPAVDDLARILDAIQDGQREREQMRTTLEQLRTVLGDALT